jgi:phosphatidate phosphatase LPIN
VDGTVTKSDLPGHILPRLGISDWAHDGIANLLTNIEKNGYKIVYLTARPIGYSGTTKNYLASIKQEGKFKMPDGPLLLSPNRLAKSLFVEVVIK